MRLECNTLFISQVTSIIMVDLTQKAMEKTKIHNHHTPISRTQQLPAHAIHPHASLLSRRLPYIAMP